MSKQKINLFVGSIGAFIGIFVFIAYIPQIFANLQGDKAQPLQPLFAAISCLIWVIYGWTKEPKKDWILIIPNSAGVILGGLTFLTAL
ncbi:SemiSWEET family transporter [Oribacterium sinus]|mgnify:FL=1|jgi:integral membrane protein|uniref:SemiSWEET family transporter n=1 Tax=Oribacterium sinus TaxID=237576 RepID=UPI0028ED6E7F|nr:SemiSWEET family transporter [Oribacterium sinus]